eukprot:112536_1
MGLIFSAFSKSEFDTAIIDFETATPPESEKQLFESVQQFLNTAEERLRQAESYEPCTDFIRAAMQASPEESEEAEQVAYEKVCEKALFCRDLWNLAKDFHEMIQNTLVAITKVGKNEPIVSQQALCFKLTQLFDRMLKFDEIKMRQPALQNDFAYYRRQVPKHANDPNLPVKDDEASFVSMFLAAACPMMASVAKSIGRVSQDTNDAILPNLAMMAHTCFRLVQKSKFSPDSKYNNLCMRSMVSCIVIYDTVSPTSIFRKSPPFDMKQASSFLIKEYPKRYADQPDSTPLVNMIKYSCPHFNDDETPSHFQSLFDI